MQGSNEASEKFEGALDRLKETIKASDALRKELYWNRYFDFDENAALFYRNLEKPKDQEMPKGS